MSFDLLRRYSHYALMLAVLLAASSPYVAGAAELCIGYSAESKRWGILDMTQGQQIHCPTGTAAMAIRTTFGAYNPGEKVSLGASCCPVPPNSLTEERIFSFASCPDGFVITGQRFVPPKEGEGWRELYELECTKINSELYELVDAETLWTDDWVEDITSLLPFRRPWILSNRFRIPPALRFGLGRKDRFSWLSTFCMGYPWGSLAVGLGGHYCWGVRFRTLRPRNPSPDKPCRAVSDPFSPEAECLP